MANSLSATSRHIIILHALALHLQHCSHIMARLSPAYSCSFVHVHLNLFQQQKWLQPVMAAAGMHLLPCPLRSCL